MTIALKHAASAEDLRADVKQTNVHFTWSRAVKILGALALVGVGTYAVAADQVAIATDNAVVSAYAVTLRTPIEGVVSGAALRIGQSINRGVVIAKVENARTDDQHLVDLQGHLERVRATLEATTTEIEALEKLQSNLRDRSQDYVSAIKARLSGSALEAKNLLESAIVKRDMAGRTLARLSSLADRGITTTAELDKAQSDADIAKREVEAQSGHVAAVQAQLDAAAHGIVSDPGSTDVAYSSQRADEISMRIGQLKHEYALGQPILPKRLHV